MSNLVLQRNSTPTFKEFKMKKWYINNVKKCVEKTCFFFYGEIAMNGGYYTALQEVSKAKQNIVPDAIGRYGQGNIDLYNRPQFRQPDGSVSTVRSMSFGDENGQEILVPTIANDYYGKPYQMTDQQAIDRYYDTGEYLGKFNSIADADNYGQALHNQQEQLYSQPGLNGRNTAYLNALYNALSMIKP